MLIVFTLPLNLSKMGDFRPTLSQILHFWKKNCPTGNYLPASTPLLLTNGAAGKRRHWWCTIATVADKSHGSLIRSTWWGSGDLPNLQSAMGSGKRPRLMHSNAPLSTMRHGRHTTTRGRGILGLGGARPHFFQYFNMPRSPVVQPE